MKSLFALVVIINFGSCIYKAGNRQPDINQRYDISISPFYIKKYMKGLDSFYTNQMLLTSEMVNYPENFIPVTDSIHGYKYVIEFHSLDSATYIEEHYINLASLYDFNRHEWIRTRQRLQNDELSKFKLFFRDSVLKATVNRYKDIVPDTLLFVSKKHIATIEELD